MSIGPHEDSNPRWVRIKRCVDVRLDEDIGSKEMLFGL